MNSLICFSATIMPLVFRPYQLPLVPPPPKDPPPKPPNPPPPPKPPPPDDPPPPHAPPPYPGPPIHPPRRRRDDTKEAPNSRRKIKLPTGNKKMMAMRMNRSSVALGKAMRSDSGGSVGTPDRLSRVIPRSAAIVEATRLVSNS